MFVGAGAVVDVGDADGGAVLVVVDGNVAGADRRPALLPQETSVSSATQNRLADLTNCRFNTAGRARGVRLRRGRRRRTKGTRPARWTADGPRCHRPGPPGCRGGADRRPSSPRARPATP